jgi:hypothetical protein
MNQEDRDNIAELIALCYKNTKEDGFVDEDAMLRDLEMRKIARERKITLDIHPSL